MTTQYHVSRLQQPLTIDADWDKKPWQNITPLAINNHMGDKPEHFPPTQARLLYDDHAIYVIFRVEDHYVRAVADHLHGPVWCDSCVEFFFTPGPDIAPGYFNLETNCGSTFLFHHQTKNRTNNTPLSPDDCARIDIASTLPRIVEPERVGPLTWTLEYRLPFDIIKIYAPLEHPAPGITWRANFYKCADHTSHPHWITWAPIDLPQPMFHAPEFFGSLIFT